MMRAYCLIRDQPVYRRDAFMAGLRAAGYDARTGGPQGCSPGDVLVIWNRYAEWHDRATAFERAGGTVLVAENGYVRGRHDGGEYYALAIGGHNGSGRWHVGGPERWNALGVELKPWRTEGDHILVCPNRSFGRPDTIMPYDWSRKMFDRLKAVTKREIRIRPHPGNGAPKVPLAHDLRNAWAVVVWSSSAGVKALIEGIPIICEAPFWICKDAAAADPFAYGIDGLLVEPISDYAVAFDVRRRMALHALAWAQFSLDEISSGSAFEVLTNGRVEAHTAVA